MCRCSCVGSRQREAGKLQLLASSSLGLSDSSGRGGTLTGCVCCVLTSHPAGMQRRQINSTRYDPRARKLFWRLEWRFPAATPTTPAAAAATAADASLAQSAQAAAVASSDVLLQQQQPSPPQPLVLFDGKVDEEAVLSAVLARHLEYRQGQGAQALQLRAYREAGAGAGAGDMQQGLTVLMRKERCPVSV